MTIAPGELLREGPYGSSVVQGMAHSTRPAGKAGSTRPVKLPLAVTVPVAASPSSGLPPGPFPVCVLLNGFQARASYYAPLARRLASWGVVVVQYNAPPLTIIPDAAELPFLGDALAWLKRAAGSEAAQPALQGRADLDRLVVAGHSRGGKLAALHYCAGEVAGLPIRAAFLIDPVDNTTMAPEGPDYPSAHKALKAANRPFGMAAAGRISASNPEGSNWKLFAAAAPPGSWAMVLRRAGHTSFMQPPMGIETFLLDRIFGGGPARRDNVVSETAAAMLGWFGGALADAQRPRGSSSAQQQQPLAAIAAGAPVAAAGLSAAAATVAASPAAAVAEAGEEQREQSWGGQLAAAFTAWVTSPLRADELDWQVKA